MVISEHNEESEDSLFNIILENSRDVVYIMDFQNNKFEFISPSIQEMTGYSKDELLATDKEELIKIIHEDYREIFKNHYYKLQYKSAGHRNFLQLNSRSGPK